MSVNPEMGAALYILREAGGEKLYLQDKAGDMLPGPNGGLLHTERFHHKLSDWYQFGCYHQS